jgi:hypothetical protein
VAPPDLWGPWCEQFWICIISESFHVNMTLFWLSSSRGEDFQMHGPPHFCIFVIISPLKKTWPFTWTTWNSLYPRMICTKFDWNWTAGSGEDFFFKFPCIFTLLLLSPLGEGQSPSFEQFRIPSPKDDLFHVWLKLVQWFWRRSQKCKSLQTDRRTNGRRTTGDQKSSLELSAQVSKHNIDNAFSCL